MPNGKVVKVNDPTWVGDTIKLVNKYQLPKVLYLTLPNMINYYSNVYSIYFLVSNTANSGNLIVSNVLERGISATV